MAEVDRRDGHRRADDKHIAALVGEALEENNRRWRRTLASVAVGYLILVLGVGIGLYAVEKRDTARSRTAIAAAARVQTQTLDAAYAVCDRVNLLREEANLSSHVIFATLWASAQRERQLAMAGSRATHERSAVALKFLARQVRVTQLTDCQRAVDQAQEYRAPLPHAINPATNGLLRKLRGLAG